MSKGTVILAYKGYDVITYLVNIGQEEDFDAAKNVTSLEVYVFIEDLRATAIYEDCYLLGTSVARPCIARRLVQIARQEGAQYVSHGATGKATKLTCHALSPEVKIIAPWRIPEFYNRFRGRKALMEYDEAMNVFTSIPLIVCFNSYESGILENPKSHVPADLYLMTKNPEDAPNSPDGVPIKVTHFKEGKSKDTLLDLFSYLNEMGGRHGVGRIDIVENCFIGMKSRGFESPGGTIRYHAHLDMETFTMGQEVRRIKQGLAVKFSEMLYNGTFGEYRNCLQKSGYRQKNIRLNPFPLHLIYLGYELFPNHMSLHTNLSCTPSLFPGMDVQGDYEPCDTSGFIKINAVRLREHHRLQGEARSKH
uniref:argininosuccinate synthase n=1 Tax=Oncorhynchus tshawytscha TaxID=74940 RepID=A0A8C8ESZ8_ONCTS